MGPDKCFDKRLTTQRDLSLTALYRSSTLHPPTSLYRPLPTTLDLNAYDMADVSYAVADQRAREARQAGLQAKNDEQPANTARSYRSKQEEWRVAAPPSPSFFCPDLGANPAYRPGAISRALRLTSWRPG